MDGPAQDMTEEVVDAVGPGTILGEYAIGARLARRSQADVFEATHAPTGAPRLVYVLRPEAVQDHPFVHQVICEVDAARWLRHPAIAKVDGYGDAPGGGLYVAADQPPGRPLGAVLAESGRMTPRLVVRMAHRLVEAIEEAHAVGLVHGRLSPTAILVAGETDARELPLMTLTGFGTGAVALDGDVSAADAPYVSPERIAGRELDVRADVFGLASVLHFALVGSPPTVAGSEADVAAEVARDIADVIAVARSADPRHRPATVKAFWEDLLAALVGDAAAMARETPLFVPTAPAMPVALADATIAASMPPTRFSGAFDPLPLLSPSAPRAWPSRDTRDEEPAAPAFAASPRTSGSVDGWGIVPQADVVPAVVPAPVVDLALVPLAAEPPAVPAPVRVAEEERPAPAVQFRETWERQRPSLSAPAAPSTQAAPKRRRRTALALVWWLAVPAAAAAAGWPLTRGGADERSGGVSNSTAAFSIIPGQEMPRTPGDTLVAEYDELADSTALSPMPEGELAPAARGAEALEVVEQPRLPAVAPVSIPTVALPGVELPKKPAAVRSSDFGIAPPGGR